MRFQSYINEGKYKNFHAIIMLCDDIYVNEMTDKTFNTIKSAGGKLGLKVAKSNTLFGLLKSAGKDVDEIVRLAALYMITDITDNKSRQDIVKDAKSILKKVNIKNLMTFLFQVDKLSLGITSHLRHIMMSIFGVEITTYNYYKQDIDYLKSEINNIKQVLKRMGNTENELKLLKNLENSIMSLSLT